jgi:hypothetical protein
MVEAIIPRNKHHHRSRKIRLKSPAPPKASAFFGHVLRFVQILVGYSGGLPAFLIIAHVLTVTWRTKKCWLLFCTTVNNVILNEFDKASTITSTTRHGNLPRHNSMLFDTSVFMVDCPFPDEDIGFTTQGIPTASTPFVIPRQLLRSDTSVFKPNSLDAKSESFLSYEVCRLQKELQ